jgi:ABC-2 type transport system permease protein
MFESMARFARQSLFAYRALFGWLRPRDYLIMKALEPATQIIFFSVLGAFAGKDPAYFALGNAVRVASVSGLFGCASVMLNERRSGTLQGVTASATPLAQTFIARSALQGLDGLTTIAVGFSLGGALFGLDFSQVHWGWMLLALLVTSYAMSGLGVLVATSGLVGTDLNLTMNLAYAILIVLCGANFPVEALPLAVQVVSRALPLTHGLAAVRDIFAGSLTEVPRLILVEAALGALYAALGYVLFRVAEHRARALGTLELV